MLFNSSGYVLNSGVSGCIRMKSYLQPNSSLQLFLSPSLKIGHLNDNSLIKLDDINFHNSVDTSTFDLNRSLSIQPPSGEFTLMSYRVAGDCHEPFKVYPYINRHSYTLTINLTIKTMFSKGIFADYLNVSFRIGHGLSVKTKIQT